MARNNKKGDHNFSESEATSSKFLFCFDLQSKNKSRWMFNDFKERVSDPLISVDIFRKLMLKK